MAKDSNLLKDLQIQTRQDQHHLNKGEKQNPPGLRCHNLQAKLTGDGMAVR